MATTIVTKNGSGAPTDSDLVAGELAVDLTNGRLYTTDLDSGGTVLELGTNPASDVTFGDNTKAIFGDGSDLQIYHDASDSIINDNGTGSLKLQQGGSTKLEVTGTGIDVTGTVTADGLTVSSTGEVVSTISSTSTSGARGAKLRLNVASTGGDDPAGTIEFTYGTGYTVAGSIAMSHTNPAMKFLTGTTERMRIDNSGNVGIGNGGLALTRLAVTNSVVGANIETTSSDAGHEGLIVNRQNSDGIAIAINQAGTTVGSIGSYVGTHLRVGSGEANLLFATPNVLPATSTGLNSDGVIDLGATDRRFKDLYLSGGVKLSGTSGIDDLSTSVSTSAVVITSAVDYGTLSIVAGNSAGNIFTDLVFWATTMGATVVTSGTVSGAPAARTYTVVGSALKLAMASGTYAVKTTNLKGSL
jgi:hypothetical protein